VLTLDIEASERGSLCGFAAWRERKPITLTSALDPNRPILGVMLGSSCSAHGLTDNLTLTARLPHE
jgi:hypothetical protein